MKPSFFVTKFAVVVLGAFTLAACSGDGTAGEASRVQNLHLALTVEDPSVSGSSLAQSVSAQALISLGSIYLESQVAPLATNGLSLQAEDVAVANGNSYVSYGYFDPTGATRAGAVESLKPYACNLLGASQFCLSVGTTVSFLNANINAAFVNGSNLFAVGATTDESSSPNYARLYKVGLDANANPTALQQTVVLPSYAGTSVTGNASKLFVTSGTSTDSSRVGGLSIFNIADLTTVSTQNLYDARAVAIEKGDASKVMVTRGAIDGTNKGALVEYNADGTGTALRTIANGGNNIAESKSDVLVGNSLILESLGDQGFKVLCRSTGATLASQAAPTVTGIPASRTVTNSVAAAPGYLFAANGEAGVYIYRFSKSSALNTNYCQGVTLTLLGRLKLDSYNSDLTYVNAELSANSIRYVPVYNLLNVITAKLLVIASGNKGVSLLAITDLTLSLTDVDDF